MTRLERGTGGAGEIVTLEIASDRRTEATPGLETTATRNTQGAAFQARGRLTRSCHSSVYLSLQEPEQDLVQVSSSGHSSQQLLAAAG